MSVVDLSTTPEASPAARAEASLWIVRLHGPQRSPELEAGFRAWLVADPENAREFERVTEVWDAAPALADASLPRMARWHIPYRPPLARAAAIFSACAAIALGGYWLWREPAPAYVTAIGEQRTVRLDDGTRISLNSATRLEIAYRATERRVQLQGGEAYFEVARDAARSFVVVAGDRQVTALGTAFAVRCEPNRISVALVEGKVTVAPLDAQRSLASAADRPDAAAAPPVSSSPTAAAQFPATRASSAVQTLLPGQRLTVDADRPAQLDQPRMDVVMAWRRGEVVLDKTTLADAVTEMNRYDKTILVIDDGTLEELRISGVYKTGDSRSFAYAAARMLGLQAAERDGRIHLRR